MTVTGAARNRGGTFILSSEAISLQLSVPRILLSALGGLVCGVLGILLAKFLLHRRGLDDPFTAKNGYLPIIAMLLPGAAVGAFTGGIVPPIVGLLLMICCLTVSVTDCAHRILPNEAVLAILLIKLLFGIPTLCGVQGFLPFDLIQSLIGLACCFAVFALPGLFGKKVGAGDIKLAAAAGFFLGINYALLAVMLMGVFVIIYSIVQRKVPFLSFFKTYIPMGPFIAAGLFIAYLFSLNLSF